MVITGDMYYSDSFVTTRGKHWHVFMEHAEHVAWWEKEVSAMQVSGLVENPYCVFQPV